MNSLDSNLGLLDFSYVIFLENGGKLSYRDKGGNGVYWQLRAICLAGGQEGLE